jgi:hypothetical protein
MFGNIKFLPHPHPFYSKERQTKSLLRTQTTSTTENKKLDFLFFMSRIESNRDFSIRFGLWDRLQL